MRSERRYLGGFGGARYGGRGREKIGDGVVEAREVHGHPGAQEDDIRQQRLVLECCPEGAVFASVHARPQRLHEKTPHC